MRTTTLILASTFFLLSAAFNVNAQKKDSLSQKTPDTTELDGTEPLFKLKGEQLTNTNRFLRYSAITGYREGVKPIANPPYYGIDVNKEQGTTRTYMLNLSIQDMLTHGRYTDNQVILEVKDPSKYRYDPKLGSKEEWMRKNAHGYELMMPTGVASEKVLDNDLAGVLGLKFGPQKRMKEVLVLVRTSEKDKIKSREKGDASYDEKGKFNNISLDSLAKPLQAAGLPLLVNETNYKGKVDLKLKIKSWTDLAEIRKELNRYDLDLKPEQREMTVFVITEIK